MGRKLCPYCDTPIILEKAGTRRHWVLDGVTDKYNNCPYRAKTFPDHVIGYVNTPQLSLFEH